jgi:hypothetical protein
MSPDYFYVPIWTNDISHLGIIRSLGLSGEDYHSLRISWPSMPKTFSEHSKFMRGHTNIGNPHADLNMSISLAQKKCLDLVDDVSRLRFIPASDTAQIFLNHLLLRFGLSTGSVHPSGTNSQYCNYFDKSFHENIIAKTMGVASLRTTFDAHDYPKIIKPAKKDLGNSFSRVFGTKAIPIRSAAELAELDLRGFCSSDLIAQKLIDWDDWSEMPCYFYFANGRSLFSSAVKKHCIFPSPNGTSYLLEHIRVEPALQNAGEQLGAQLRWNGPLMIEFAHHKTRLPAVIEINTRPWLLNEAFRQLGTDYISGLKGPAPLGSDTTNISLWTRGICAQIARGEDVKGFEKFLEKQHGQTIRDPDYLDEDPSPFELSISHFNKNRSTRRLFKKVLMAIKH